MAAAPSGDVEDTPVVGASGVPDDISLVSSAVICREAVCSARTDSGDIPGRTCGDGGPAPAGAAARPLPRPRAPEAGGGGRGGLVGRSAILGLEFSEGILLFKLVLTYSDLKIATD